MLKKMLIKTANFMLDIAVLLLNVGFLNVVLKFDSFLTKEYSNLPGYEIFSWQAFAAYALIMRKIMLWVMPGIRNKWKNTKKTA